MENSIWEEQYDEVALLGSQFVHVAMYIQELKEENKKLLELVQSKKPICPYCKSELCPINYSHYYSEGDIPFWGCNCDEFPKEANASNSYGGY